MDWSTFWQLVIAVTVLQALAFLGVRLVLGLVLRDIYARLDDLDARLDALEGAEPPFVVGEDYPDEGNVGAGILRAYPAHDITEPMRYSGPGEVVRDIAFWALVVVDGDGWVFENCAFRGPDSWSAGGGGSNLLDTTKSTGTVLRYCDVNPQTPDSHWNGVGYKNYRLEMCHVWGCTDDLAAFALKSDPDPAVHVAVLGTWLEGLSQFKPDVAGNRDVTHNDLIQCQGNRGPADDVLLDGCRLDGYHSAEASEPTPPEHTQISAVMLSPSGSCQDRVCITVRRSWLTGGVQTLNASAPSNALSTVVLTDNVWEVPHASTGGPGAAISLDASLTDRTLEGNTYPDGSPVPVYSG